MHRQWVRLTSVIIMLVAAVLSGFHLLHLERQRDTLERQGARYDEIVGTILLSLADLRAAQQGYVASGQDPELWVSRVDDELTGLAEAIRELETRSVTAPAVEAVDALQQVVDRWIRVDQVARQHTEGGQALLASDLVFVDSLDLIRRAGGHLELARSAEQEARAEQRATRRAAQLWTMAGAGATVTLVTLLLLPSPAGRAVSTGGPDAGRVEGGEPSPDDAEAVSGRQPSDSLLHLSTPTRRPAAPFTPDLAMAARVCTDLSRLSSAASLDSSLGEACRLLDASGLILWVRDASGRALRAAAGHGYPAGTLARLGRVAANGDNVTAAAFRTGQAELIAGDDHEASALAVPLLAVTPPGSETGSTDARGSSAGCIGVLSIELPQGREADPALQATASILAAQLATLVGTDPGDADRHTSSSDAQAHALG